MESSYNNKIYKYSIRDTTEPLGDGSSGGSGNYSTAQLTITNAINEKNPIAGIITAAGPCVDNVTLGVPVMAPAAYIQLGETNTLTVLLYKGRCAFGIMADTANLEYEYEGNVEQLILPNVGKYHVITGDATIIVSNGGK